MGALFVALMVSGSLQAQESEVAEDADTVAAETEVVVVEDVSEEDGLGLTAGLELGFGDVLDKPVISLMPNVVFERSFGALDVFGELDYTVFFDDPVGQELYDEVELGYNIPVSEAGTLTLTLNNQNTFFLAPELEDGLTHLGMLQPAVQYIHTLAPGDFGAKVGLPFSYLTGIKDETALDMYLTLSWGSNFGLGVELTGTFALDPDADFTSYGLLVSYEKGQVYGEVEFIANKDFTGFEIYPEVDVTLGSFVVIARMEICKEDSDSDWSLAPFLGVGYKF
jgi:hypothetical protein